MKNRILISTLLIFCQVFLFGESNLKGPTLLKINGEPISVQEFKYIYEKNNSKDPKLYTEENLKEYMQMFTNFKLKVLAAKTAGVDTSKKFLDEYKTYRSQLSSSYMTDKSVTSALMDEAQSRMGTEIRASHILLNLKADDSQRKVDSVLKIALKIKDTLKKGADFEKVARLYSQDPSAQYNGGDLGFFSAFMMIYPFESAAFNLKKNGDISDPVRTQFGYHIIKKTDERPYRGELKIKHILLNDNEKATAPERKAVQDKIESIYSKLKSGEKFEDLAKTYSDHQQSKESGGELPWFNSFATYPPEFMDNAFGLKNIGDYTKPFQTTYGWHILKLESKRGLKSRKENEDFLKNKISRDSRAEKSKESAKEKFIKEYGFKLNESSKKLLYKEVDTSIIKGNFRASSLKSNSKNLIKIGDKKLSIGDFGMWLEKNQTPNKYSDREAAIEKYIENYSDKQVFDYADGDLENKYDEFKNISREYKEGIMLFEITDRNVWNKASSDSTGQMKYFQANKSKYVFNDRAEAYIFDFKVGAMYSYYKSTQKVTKDKKGKKIIQKDSLLAKISVIDYIKNGIKNKELPNKISDKLNLVDPLTCNFKSGLFEKGENDNVDRTNFAPGIWDFSKEGRTFLVYNKEIKAAEPKKFNEVKGQVISAYQDVLEKEWMESLKKKYPVEINQSEYNKLLKK